MAVTGTESRFRDMKMEVKELEVDGQPVTGAAPAAPTAGDVTVTPPGTDAGWTDVQAALDDIASRLADLENPA
jgi:hypothetical protein